MNPDYLQKLEEAEKFAAEKYERIKHTPHRLGFHITPPANWINDPNGLIQYKGEYHVFYQYHPFIEEWGPMYWGHVKSSDLVHWKHLPVALAPFEDYDKDGCFSGSAVEEKGELVLIYTGNVWLKNDPNELIQVQCIARSKDGIHFEKDKANPVLKELPIGASNHFRDPKVWKENDKWYMVLGNKESEKGKVLLYQSSDLMQWDYIGILAENKGENLGFMWECPDFFKLDGKHVLLISPEGMEAEGENYRNLKQSGYFVGEFNDSGYRHGHFQELDKGHDFYAVQTFEDEQGRRLLFGWMDMWEQEMPTKKDGWAGALTLPRELELRADGKLIMKPVKELEKLRMDQAAVLEEIFVEGENTLAFGEMLEMKAEFSLTETSAEEFGLKMRCGETEETVIIYNKLSRKLVLDREKSGAGPKEVRSAAVKTVDDKLVLHIYLDRSSIEVFANGGETVMTSRIYPGIESQGVKVFATGGKVKVNSLRIWNLEDIWAEK
ncbi:glycoside hydrolase family 32 protein [Metabacillus sp. RGM 3146]|uniref:glycoside hydrolase family 32 protein n=1 Tax=Metabacillus sp. RGM 3146 TaxID=3401092 RepID=UPI003B9C21E3